MSEQPNVPRSGKGSDRKTVPQQQGTADAADATGAPPTPHDVPTPQQAVNNDINEPPRRTEHDETTRPPQPPRGAVPRVSSPGEFSRFGELVIEVGDDRNRNFLYPPTGGNLRGWWRKANLIGVTIDERMTKMPDLPGIHIVLDCQRRKLRIVDPLSAPHNKAILAQAQAVYKELFRENAGPEQDAVKDDLTDTEMKTHLYWMRRFIDGGQASVVGGNVPSMATIEALPGYTRVEAWNSSARARKWREEPEAEVAQRNQAATNW